MFLVPDAAWKFGCGRYIQKPGALQELPAEMARYGRRALLIAGQNAWQTVREQVQTVLDESRSVLRIYTGTCNETDARRFAGELASNQLEMVVGIGGGKIMDTAKLIGELSHRPVINIPTICATCAAYTPLSVLYTQQGKALGSWYFDTEIACVIVDTQVLARQPLRYAAAGIADSIAKIIEIDHNIQQLPDSIDFAIAQHNAAFISQELTALAQKLPALLRKGEPTQEVETLAYLTIPATGLVSGAARGKGQAAQGHALYETVRTLYTQEAKAYLHGEIVGVGLRMQMIYDRLDHSELDSIMSGLGLPMKLSEIGVPSGNEQLQDIADTMLQNPLLHEDASARQRMLAALGAIA